MRCFVAIKLADPVRHRMEEAQRELREVGAKVKWTEADKLHLTLKFLGEIGEGQVAALRERLAAEASRRPGLELRFEGLGVFPEMGAPRIVWAGCTGEAGKLETLAGAVERVAEEVGVPRERRPFTAHVTLGRVKAPKRGRELRAAVERRRGLDLGSQEARAVTLMRSTLTSAGPVYEDLASLPLSG